YARGPLKVRALLAEHAVQLIVWKENTGNPALNQDLAEVWAQWPSLPVVHLFSRGIRAAPLPASPQVRESLPVESAGSALLPVVRRLIKAQAPRAHGSELDVRNAVLGLRKAAREAHKPGCPEPGMAATHATEFQMPGTAVNRQERELLHAGAGAASAASPWRQPLRWVRQRLQTRK
ncbi:MAG TPA: hypothetical protein VL359_06425, partial [bacterium]|nr:hypothetical protein [bacterium]